MQIPKRASQVLHASKRHEDRHMSAEAAERIKKTIDDLERHQRPQAVQDVSTAVQKGDLSENAEYHEARARLSRIDTRLFNLKEKLKNAVIIQKGNADGRVRIGSTVTLESNGERKTYEILGSLETDPSRNKISHRSPLGSALMDHTVGDEVAVQTPRGEAVYRVVEVG